MRKQTLAALAFAAGLAVSGCESHQAKVDALQKQYNRLQAQFIHDCGAEATEQSINPISHPKLSPKCEEENKQTTEAWKRLQEEKAKK